jgi:hypothetical protein
MEQKELIPSAPSIFKSLISKEKENAKLSSGKTSQ